MSNKPVVDPLLQNDEIAKAIGDLSPLEMVLMYGHACRNLDEGVRSYFSSLETGGMDAMTSLAKKMMDLSGDPDVAKQTYILLELLKVVKDISERQNAVMESARRFAVLHRLMQERRDDIQSISGPGITQRDVDLSKVDR